MNIFKSAALVAAATALIVAVPSGTLSAHTPEAQPSCYGIDISATRYEGGPENNRVTLIVDGTVVVDELFGQSFVDTIEWDPYGHEWSVVIDANLQTGRPNRFDWSDSGEEPACEYPTTTTTTTTTTVAPTTAPPTTAPVTEPPTTTQPPATTTTTTATTTTTTEPATTTTPTTAPPAETTTTTTEPVAETTTTTTQPAATTTTIAQPTTTQPSPNLPVTGSSSATTAIVALLALAAGGLLVLVSRRSVA